MPVRSISTEQAPRAIGPYSQAVVANGFVFVSGQLPMDPLTGQIVNADISLQTRRTIENIRCILQAAGTDLDQVVKTTIFLRDLGQFDAVNEAYADYFVESRPARATVEVSRLPKGAEIEIEAVAAIPGAKGVVEK